MEKVTFLFGAGAEMCYGMKSGNAFLLDSIGGKPNAQKRSDELKSFFDDYDQENFTYRKDAVFNELSFIKTCIYNKAVDQTDSTLSFLHTYEKQVPYFLSKNSRSELIKELEGCFNDFEKWKDWAKTASPEFPGCETSGNKTVKDELKSLFKKALLGEVTFEQLKTKDINGNTFDILQGLFKVNEKGDLELGVSIPASGLLDSYFHTIINPKKYGIGKFSKVFNYYWFCYMSMIDDIFNSSDIDTSKLQEYLNSNNEPDYKKILENIAQFTKDIYSEKLLIKNVDSYYSLIKKQFEAWEKEYKSEYNAPEIVTTNYFRFCEVLKKDPIYLNGNLKEFEFPETLEVKDLNHEIDLPDGMFFPFIWGQSYVKPIVHRKQIEQYTRFAKALEETDVLVILGYNINPDDNHINAFLREYVVREGTRTIVVVSKEDKKNVNEKLHLNKGIGNIEYCEVDYIEHSIGQIVYQLFQTMNLKGNGSR